MLLLTSLDNANILRPLGILLVVLIWLFFFRVIRAVWVEVRPPRRWRRIVEEALASQGKSRRRRGRGVLMRLRVVEPEESSGQVYEIGQEVTVGRAAGCAVHIDDAFASNLHARLFRRDGTLWVEDLGSTNGTWLNRARLSAPTKLSRGDRLQVGGVVFEVER